MKLLFLFFSVIPIILVVMVFFVVAIMCTGMVIVIIAVVRVRNKQERRILSPVPFDETTFSNEELELLDKD